MRPELRIGLHQDPAVGEALGEALHRLQARRDPLQTRARQGPDDGVALVLLPPALGLPVVHHQPRPPDRERSEEHTSELQSLMRISYAVFCLKKKIITTQQHYKKTKNK